MPIYEYQCEHCGAVLEVLQKISEKPLNKCTQCSGKLHKLISQSAFHLKGSGWYVTDYAGKSKKPDSSPGDTETSTSSKSAGEAKSADSPKSGNDA
ncbi:FmdB family zinc ribbon protein [Desulfatitalea alkaliphila]|uniref:Zinc ribbon domain-containing protein n=1 Tax=Desulfatitalea alkaliphila TaxID=2929485 RepID=A0AA41RB57_9BACT|nr:FmdB family zinc ribbon protein [Desulfatitalea alkaliphila]MCJ8501938.1 zinc ribbon domain-containing protein [Desulfatitalea alkaliphila]